MNDSSHPAPWSMLVALVGMGIMLACGLWAPCVTLFAADKLSVVQFKACTAFCALVALAFVALAFLLRMGWLGKASRVPARYVWSSVLVTLVLSLLCASALYGNLLILELSVVPLIFMVYLLRCTLLRRVQPRQPWEYHLIEHLSDESTMLRTDRGSVVKKVRNAQSRTVFAEAIFEHPPEENDTVIQFSVVGIAEHVDRLRLEGNYGILERCEDDDGQLQTSKFPIRTGNKVRFEVRINQRSILLDERDDYGWVAIECLEPLIPHKGRLLVELRTNCLGDPSWNWAAWGELKLVEWK